MTKQYRDKPIEEWTEQDWKSENKDWIEREQIRVRLDKLTNVRLDGIAYIQLGFGTQQHLCCEPHLKLKIGGKTDCHWS